MYIQNKLCYNGYYKMEKTMYTITSDINYTTSKSSVERFAKEHGCFISDFTYNGPAGGNHEVTFKSEILDHIQELADQLQLPHSHISGN